MTALSALRVGRITASRVPKILGLSPWGTAEDVKREMVREYFGDEPEFTGNFITEYGQLHELDAVAEYELTRGVPVRYAGSRQRTVVHPVLDWLAATPDGEVGEDGLLEAKCPWRAPYSVISQRPDYEVQIRTQLECTQRHWADFAVWREGSPITVSRVEHDPAWLPGVLDELEAFLEDFTATIESEALAAPYRAPLVDQRTDPDWMAWSYHYRELLYLQEQLGGELEEAKAELVRLAGTARSTRGGGLLLTRSEPKGRINYQTALKTLAPSVTDKDLERFRGKAKDEPTWTVRKSEK